jgi:hypothetical protein
MTRTKRGLTGVPGALDFEVLAANPDLGHVAASLEEGPLANHVDPNLMREINPEILSFRSWLAGSGRKALDEALLMIEE